MVFLRTSNIKLDDASIIYRGAANITIVATTNQLTFETSLALGQFTDFINPIFDALVLLPTKIKPTFSLRRVRKGSNLRHTVLETAALPAELHTLTLNVTY